MLLKYILTLILTVPIHCRGSIGEQVKQVMNCYISQNIYRLQTILAGLRLSTFPANFGVNYSFKCLHFIKTLLLMQKQWGVIYMINVEEKKEVERETDSLRP